MQLEQTQAEADVASNDRKVQADIALAEKKFAFERELKILDFQFKQQLETLKAKQQQQAAAVQIMHGGDEMKISHGADEIMTPMADAIGKMGESLGRMQAQHSEALMQAVKGMNAPKRVVRDPKTNRVVAVETMTNGDAR